MNQYRIYTCHPHTVVDGSSKNYCYKNIGKVYPQCTNNGCYSLNLADFDEI